MITLRYRCKSTTSMQKLYEPKYENEHQVVFLSKAPSITFRNQESFLPKIFIKI